MSSLSKEQWKEVAVLLREEANRLELSEQSRNDGVEDQVKALVAGLRKRAANIEEKISREM